jgi:hypothetical protein
MIDDAKRQAEMIIRVLGSDVSTAIKDVFRGLDVSSRELYEEHGHRLMVEQYIKTFALAEGGDVEAETGSESQTAQEPEISSQEWIRRDDAEVKLLDDFVIKLDRLVNHQYIMPEARAYFIDMQRKLCDIYRYEDHGSCGSSLNGGILSELSSINLFLSNISEVKKLGVDQVALDSYERLCAALREEWVESGQYAVIDYYDSRIVAITAEKQ